MGRIGMIDWGIGGIGIYRRLKERFPRASVTYFSDTGFTPYGKTTRRELIERLERVVRFLREHYVTQVVIACNAASTVVDELRCGGIEVSGVIKPAIDLAANLKPQDLGLIGGRRTVVSGVYRRGLAAEGIALKQRIAQPLSGLIEKGEIDSPVLHFESERILKPLAHCSHILLACTHYPAIADLLSRYVSPKTQFIDPADAVVSRLDLSRIMTHQRDIFLTTGSVKVMRRAAKAAWAIDLQEPKQARGL